MIALHEAIAHAKGQPVDDLEYCRQRLQMPGNELDPPPLVTGDDLISHGVPRGREYQRLLAAIRDAQLEKQIATKAEAFALVDQLRREKTPPETLD